jgi:hypothetical protein
MFRLILLVFSMGLKIFFAENINKNSTFHIFQAKNLDFLRQNP